MKPITFEFELEEKPHHSLDQWDLVDQNEEEIIWHILQAIVRGGDNCDQNVLLDLCEILNLDFDNLNLTNNDGDDCEFEWANRRQELLRDVAREYTVVQVDGKNLHCTVGDRNDLY